MQNALNDVPYVDRVKEIAHACANADHVDIKTIEANMNLREFVCGCFAYQPAWVTFLYGVRWAFVRLLGMKQSGIPKTQDLDSKLIPLSVGKTLAFFNIEAAEENVFVLASVDEKHLKASLAVVAEPLSATRNRFYLVTIVHYHHWTGAVYFNAIRPFHYLVVGGMAKAGANYQK